MFFNFRKKNQGLRKTFMVILVTLIAIGLLLPSFMSVLWSLGQ